MLTSLFQKYFENASLFNRVLFYFLSKKRCDFKCLVVWFTLCSIPSPLLLRKGKLLMQLWVEGNTGKHTDPLLVFFYAEGKGRSYINVVVNKKLLTTTTTKSFNEVINNATKTYVSCHLRFPAYINLISSKLCVCVHDTTCIEKLKW